jgi:hypothetical protein
MCFYVVPEAFLELLDQALWQSPAWSTAKLRDRIDRTDLSQLICHSEGGCHTIFCKDRLQHALCLVPNHLLAQLFHG